MNNLRIRPLNEASDATVAAWVDLRRRAAAHDMLAGPPLCETGLRGSLRVPPSATEVVECAAFDGTRIVGAVRLEFQEMRVSRG
jgi:hypothetical protein